MAGVGFKRMTIQILDGKTPALGSNQFVIEGAPGKGGTKAAKISGIAASPVKTYASNIAYYISSTGVGDVKAEFDVVDFPRDVLSKILGHKTSQNGITRVGADTVAPFCSILLESATTDGTPFYAGFYKGQFSLEAFEFNTLSDKQEELPADSLTFTAIASDAQATEGAYYGTCASKEANTVNAFKAELKMVNAA